MVQIRNSLLSLLTFGAAATMLGEMAGCTKHTVDVQPIKVEPIHMTVDVNIKVDRELDEFFEFEDEVIAPVPGDMETPGTAPQAEPIPSIPPPPGGDAP